MVAFILIYDLDLWRSWTHHIWDIIRLLFGKTMPNFNSYSASHDNWYTGTLLITAQWEGMGDVGSVRYEPALLPPCPTIRVLNYSNCQRSTHSISKWIFRNSALYGLTQGSFGKGIKMIQKYLEWFVREMYTNALRWQPFYKNTIVIIAWIKPLRMILVSRPMFFMIKECDGAICFHQWPWPFKIMTFAKSQWILFVLLSTNRRISFSFFFFFKSLMSPGDPHW